LRVIDVGAELAWIYWAAGLITLGLFAYLLYALFNAEDIA
jgi:K+-transporting ATPase KdpF subunit